jgi:hypothetical protein
MPSMSDIVVDGAVLKCAIALPPGIATLKVLPAAFVDAGSKPIATIMDNKPLVNIPSFGMCPSQLNKATAVATAAAAGTPTPGACTPVIVSPWSPGSPTVSVGNKPALTSSSTCACTSGGTISVQSANQTTTSTG